MTKILRVESSIKGENSVSRNLTDRIIDRLTAAGDATVTLRDLSGGVPLITADWIGAVFTPAEARSAEQSRTAAFSDELLAEVRAADVLVIALPVYNFGVPATLKSWIDHLARKGESFNYTETGPVGLLTGKRAIIAMASDGTKIGSEVDFASGYVRHMLGFFGITDVEFIAADAVLFGGDVVAKAHTAIESIAA